MNVILDLLETSVNVSNFEQVFKDYIKGVLIVSKN